jgi:hypothetical protein
MSAPPTCDEYRVKEENLFDLARLLTSDEQMIYFVQSGDDGPIKIGVSTNIGKRLTALQTAHGERLRIVGVMKGDFSKEKRIHSQFKSSLKRGEWFQATPELKDFINTRSLIRGAVGIPEQECRQGETPDNSSHITFPRALDGLPPLLVRTSPNAAVRIFTPAEVDALVAVIRRPYHRTLLGVLFWTGMRYVETQQLHAHPEYWVQERGVIDLPFIPSGTGMRTTPPRQIPVPQQLVEYLPGFFHDPAPPTVQVWGRNLKRWADQAGIGSEGVSPKSTRKTIESWMVVIDVPMNKVCLRQGHDSVTSLGYYQNMAFTYDEVAEIRRRLASWV